ESLNSVLSQDFNMLYADSQALGRYHKEGYTDTNCRVMSLEGAVLLLSDGVGPWTFMDWNGITVYPDSNGEFDINITIPHLSSGTIGLRDINVIRASGNAWNIDANVQSLFQVAPKIIQYMDVNVTVISSNITSGN
ncbi:unnamed protein product, partial [marine sediment metagenome]